jgi:hypothetical protein
MGIRREEVEFNEKRLYIFAGFDDYPIASLGTTKKWLFKGGVKRFF